MKAAFFHLLPLVLGVCAPWEGCRRDPGSLWVFYTTVPKVFTRSSIPVQLTPRPQTVLFQMG